MTTAVDYLATKGVTLAQAYSFIMGNISSPATIYNVAKQFGVTNQMLGEIVGVNADVVKSFWSAQGFDAAQLDAGAATGGSQFDLYQAYLQNPVISTPYAALDASKGAFNYVIDMANVSKSGQAIIRNFGSDDTLTISNGNASYSTLAITPSSSASGHYVEQFSVFAKNFPTNVQSFTVMLDDIPSVPSGQTLGVTAMKPIPVLLTAFNSLPVGDLYWS